MRREIFMTDTWSLSKLTRVSLVRSNPKGSRKRNKRMEEISWNILKERKTKQK